MANLLITKKVYWLTPLIILLILFLLWLILSSSPVPFSYAGG
ncbi:MAG TPA: hypothetical protein VJH97_03550 [Candidatus Nanoarchaeia archaeon]|nr:hypothetical protein [Candidatus Nanoarchaeia archaeon]